MSDDGTTEDQPDGTPQGVPANADPGNSDPAKPDTGNGAQDDPEKRIDWRATSRKHEDRAKANKKAADDATAKATAAEARLAAVLKAAGLDQGDEDEDPTEAVKRAAKERDDAVAEAKSLRAERTAERLARTAGADVDLLLDSSKVRKALAGLEDPTDEDAVKAVIAAALEANPKLKATTAAQPPPATDMTGGGEKRDQLTRADLKTMTPKQIEAARTAGKLRTLLGG